MRQLVASPPLSGPWISTVSGRKLHWDHLGRAEIDIEDIATALSHICRFTGNIEDFYSVAEHSVWVSWQVPKEHMLCALLHDATEAYMNDIASPLKKRLPDYRDMESTLWQAAIAPHFDLPRILPACVKDADAAVFSAERIVMQPWTLNDPDYHAPANPAPVFFQFWTPRQARQQFLMRYRQLVREREAA